MRRHATSHVSVAIAMTVLIGGCALGTPIGKLPVKTGPVSLATKLKKVDSMTKTFSLARNDGLAQASGSLSKNSGLIKALASLQSLAASLAGAGNSSMTSIRASQAQAISAQAQDATVRATYALAATLTQNGSTLVYDDVTKEVTGLTSPDVDLSFAFKNDGATRSWTATILRSRDGTTGSFYVQLTGTWAPQPTPATELGRETYSRKSYAPANGNGAMPCPQDDSAITQTPYGHAPNGGSRAIASLNGNTSGSAELGGTTAASAATGAATTATTATGAATVSTGATSGSNGATGAASVTTALPTTPPTAPPSDTPNPNGFPVGVNGADPSTFDPSNCGAPDYTPPSPPPFKIFGGEYPQNAEAFSVKIDLVPGGDDKLKMHFEGTFDHPEQVTVPIMGNNMKLPMHWAVKMNVPKVSFDWDSHLHLEAGASTFKAIGSMATQSADGADRFVFELAGTEADKSGHFYLTNEDAKVKLAIDGSMSAAGQNVVKTHLLSTEDGSEIGLVAVDPTRPRFAIITLKDGTKKDWELYPDNLFPTPAFAPMPVPAEPAHRVPLPRLVPIANK